MTDLYTPEHCKIMQANYDFSSMNSNRVEEIRNIARGMHVTKIGIAHCITFGYEAMVLKEFLSNDFEVYVVDCKYGRLKKKDLLDGNSNRVLCNPAGQANYLNEHNTELNISMGLCVGHDMIFSKLSNAYVTNLFDKDFTNNNSPARALSDIQVNV